MNRGEIRSQAYYRLGIAAGDSNDDEYANARMFDEYRELVSELGTYRKTDPVAFTAGNPIVNLSPDTLRVLTVRLDAKEAPLLRVTPEAIAERQAFRDAQTYVDDEDGPNIFAMDGILTLIVDPPPKETTPDAGEIYYVAEPPAFTDDNSTPVHLPVAFHSVLMERLVVQLALSEEEQGLAQAAEARAAQLLDKLTRDIARRPGGHRFARPSGLPPPRVEI